ncbi:unnamed protein product [Caenorhabditis auriculariae]|uniref:Uncharacterized protein n=1 Tax=Caenorhabditis auriculariae TaxID=2777116 RepID=A0A8S1GMG8_9PELO|nr:unnamed protein product [Caenorhabditis auriculariae]
MFARSSLCIQHFSWPNMILLLVSIPLRWLIFLHLQLSRAAYVPRLGFAAWDTESYEKTFSQSPMNYFKVLIARNIFIAS